MNQKLNWTRRSRKNPAGVGVPVRFNSNAAFEVKIKNLAGKKMLELDPPLVPGIFDFRARVNGVDAQTPSPLYKRRSAMISLSLHEIMLDERRLEAVLKAARKKRC